MPLLIIVSLNNSAPDPDPLDSQDFGVLDPDLQKYAYPRIQIQGAKYHPKTAKKNVDCQTPNLNYWKREIIKFSWFLNGSSSISIQISEQNKKIKIMLKKMKCKKDNLDPDPQIKLNGSQELLNNIITLHLWSY